MADDDMRKIGIAMPNDLVDDLDERKREWDQLESRTISRSEVAREALVVGVEALEILDEEMPRGMTTRDRRSTVRQALFEFLRKEFGEGDETK